MFAYAVIGLSVLVGYLVTVLCALVTTIGVASASPKFVMANYRVRTRYKLVHELMWLLCVIAGAYATAKVGMGVATMEQEVALGAVLIFMLWRNTWEARQRGTAHQILISLLTVVGVWGGFALRAWMGG